MTISKEQTIEEIVAMLGQMDMTGLLITKSNVEVLKAKERLDKAEEEEKKAG